MFATAHAFGTPLRDAVLQGTYTQTALGQLFLEKVYQNTGIKVLYANSASDMPQLSGSYIFIYTDVKQLPVYSESQLHATQGGYEAQGDLKTSILACFQQATETLDLPPVASEITAIYIHNFATTAGSIYWSANIKSIDTMAKEAFPHLDFTLRFRLCHDCHDPQHYYLIWANEKAEEQAERNGDTTRIIDLVENFCKNHDPLGIFATQAIRPQVTNKNSLKKQGLVMGIMRNNPDFDEW